MARLKIFHYKSIAGFGNVLIDSILEVHGERIKILWLLESGNKKEVILTGKEDEFIKGLLECDILSWNGKSFDSVHEDCGSWYLDVMFDDVHIHCMGHGGYPKEYLKFMEQIGLNDNIAETERNYYKSDIKQTKVNDTSRDDFWNESYCEVNLKDIVDYEYDRVLKSKL